MHGTHIDRESNKDHHVGCSSAISNLSYSFAEPYSSTISSAQAPGELVCRFQVV